MPVGDGYSDDMDIVMVGASEEDVVAQVDIVVGTAVYVDAAALEDPAMLSVSVLNERASVETHLPKNASSWQVLRRHTCR